MCLYIVEIPSMHECMVDITHCNLGTVSQVMQQSLTTTIEHTQYRPFSIPSYGLCMLPVQACTT